MCVFIGSMLCWFWSCSKWGGFWFVVGFFICGGCYCGIGSIWWLVCVVVVFGIEGVGVVWGGMWGGGGVIVGLMCLRVFIWRRFGVWREWSFVVGVRIWGGVSVVVWDWVVGWFLVCVIE